ncbi:MAG: hypothetical protein Kow00114_32820 [Kiloniellaceae bacterium]
MTEPATERARGWLARQPARRRVLAVFWAITAAIALGLLAFALR